LAWHGKTKPNTTKSHIRQSKNAPQDKINTKKTKSGLVASYNIWPLHPGKGLFYVGELDIGIRSIDSVTDVT